MNQLLLVLAVALTVGAIVFGVIALLGGDDKGLQPVEPDGRSLPLPSRRPLVESDVSETRFDTAWRGYRMAQVDAALQRLAYDIGYKNELIEVLHAEVDALREGRFPDAEVLRRAREAALAQVEPAAGPVPPAHEQPPDESATGEPATDEPATDDPATDDPATGEPATGEPATGEPATDESAASKPGAEAPATDELAAGAPGAAEPAAEDMAADDAGESAGEPGESTGEPGEKGAGERGAEEQSAEETASESAGELADELAEEAEPAAGETADGREPAPPGTDQPAITSGQR